MRRHYGCKSYDKNGKLLSDCSNWDDLSSLILYVYRNPNVDHIRVCLTSAETKTETVSRIATIVDVAREYCSCGHKEEEHDKSYPRVCKNRHDKGMWEWKKKGCYCGGFRNE